MRVPFLSWLVRQAYRDDLVGELAGQVRLREKVWTKSDDLLALRVYLAREGGTPLAHHALRVAWVEWEASGHVPAINVRPIPGFRRS
jgi:hypothetical protein